MQVTYVGADSPCERVCSDLGLACAGCSRRHLEQRARGCSSVCTFDAGGNVVRGHRGVLPQNPRKRGPKHADKTDSRGDVASKGVGAGSGRCVSHDPH